MAYQGINTGTSPNTGSGDSLIVGAEKINSNFLQLFTAVGLGSTGTGDVSVKSLTVSGVTTLSTVSASSSITATGGFTSGTGTPVEISVVGSTLSFSVAGIGSTTLTLS